MGKRCPQTIRNKGITKLDLKHARKRLASLIMRETQIKTTLRYRFSPIRLAKIQKLMITSCWQGHGGKQALKHCFLTEKAKWYSPHGEEFGIVQQTSSAFTLRPASHTSGQ